MDLSWSVLALALIGAQDPQPAQPNPPSSSSAVEIKSRDPQTSGRPACPKASNARVEQAGAAGTLKMQLPKVAKPRTNGNPEEALESWPMTLDDAIRIGLDNSEIVRVIALGAAGCGSYHVPKALEMGTSAKENGTKPRPMLIARLNADASLWRFKSEVTAEVRSIEQSYWNLAQAHLQLWAADRAVGMAKEILQREQAELPCCRGTVADVAEAAQRLEQFKLDLVTRTSGVITTERQLRNLLGLPPADNRRIIPVTPLTEELVEFDWNTSLNEMMEEQPDIVQQKLLVRVAELQLLLARNQHLPQLSLNTLYPLDGLGQSFDSACAVMTGALLQALQRAHAETGAETTVTPGGNPADKWGTGLTFQAPLGTRTPLANARQAQYVLLRSRAYLQQIVHQTTHTLARFFLEVDANYKQYRTASRLRQAAAQRLDAQRAYYEEGRTTIDRFLDAVSQYATAVATEAQYKTTYNIALVAVAEAKGTLLADRGIVVAERSHPRKAYIQAAQPRPSLPIPADAPAKAAAPGQPVKPTPPRWAEVIPVTRRAGKRDIRAITASFDPKPFSSVEVPVIVSVNEMPLAPRSVVMPELATVPWPKAPCCETEATTDSTSTAQATPTGPACATGTVLATTDTARTTAKTEHPAKTKTWTFSLAIGSGANPLQIKGTITQTQADDSSLPKP